MASNKLPVAPPVAIVSGGASGIGEGITKLLVTSGYRVVIADIQQEAGDKLALELGEQAFYRKLNVSIEEDWKDTISWAEQELGPLSLLVNNAGTGMSADIEDATLDDWTRINDINSKGVFLGCKYAVGAMKSQGGNIINIASALGKKAMASTCVYSATKAAVVSLTESTALHCAEQNYQIRCNAVLPGFIDTPLLRNSLELSDAPEEMLQGFVALHPVGRLGTIDEVAQAVLFISSDKCQFMTGASISVDGAMTL
ncbi:MAG: SDR family oxidoreductase [Pseudomonadales bacterium]